MKQHPYNQLNVILKEIPATEGTIQNGIIYLEKEVLKAEAERDQILNTLAERDKEIAKLKIRILQLVIEYEQSTQAN